MEAQGDRFFMRRALEIAFSRMGRTSPNPAVGAVIVKGGRIIAEGGTQGYGGDHAEVDAIKKAAEPLAGSTLYATLEPCCHSGKTPPCTGAIVRAGIGRVCVPLHDPNPLVSGRGVAELAAAGVEVVMLHEEAEAALDLVRPFRKYIRGRVPYVMHKAALSLDGKTATRSGDSKWISSEYSRYIVHRLRSRADAVIVGKNTLERDNPTLNVRLGSFPGEVREYFTRSDAPLAGRQSAFIRMLLRSDIPDDGVSPLRVVMGVPRDLGEGCNVLFDGNFLFLAQRAKKDELRRRADFALLKRLEDDGKIRFLEGDSPAGFVRAALGELYSRGVMCALLEGGGVLAGSFQDAGEIDQFVYFISPRVMGTGLSPLEGHGAETVGDSLRLVGVTTALIGEDVLYNAYREL
jgi:diaminohydroxyphosphoribosylaminopyrimidine deaminase/5-amino-6-(5-phosphoribosylamino)uracil reductase